MVRFVYSSTKRNMKIMKWNELREFGVWACAACALRSHGRASHRRINIIACQKLLSPFSWIPFSQSVIFKLTARSFVRLYCCPHPLAQRSAPHTHTHTTRDGKLIIPRWMNECVFHYPDFLVSPFYYSLEETRTANDDVATGVATKKKTN